MTKEILAVCGTGASSGFMAVTVRKAAKKNLTYEIKARSESELAENISNYDLLLIAPHLKNMLDDVKKIGNEMGVNMVLFRKEFMDF